jgi:hypothetical protein
MAAVMDAWASDVSSLDEQRAAVHKREEELVAEKQGAQQLLVYMAAMAKFAQQQNENLAGAEQRKSKRQRLA